MIWDAWSDSRIWIQFISTLILFGILITLVFDGLHCINTSICQFMLLLCSISCLIQPSFILLLIFFYLKYSTKLIGRIIRPLKFRHGFSYSLFCCKYRSYQKLLPNRLRKERYGCMQVFWGAYRDRSL